MNRITIELTEDQANYILDFFLIEPMNNTFAIRLRNKIEKQLAKAKTL